MQYPSLSQILAGQASLTDNTRAIVVTLVEKLDAVIAAIGEGDPAALVAAVNKTIPATAAAAITPSDATVLTATRALFIGSTGDVAVTMAGGGDTTFTAVPSGTTLPISVTKVLSTGTTASNIVALR